MTRTHLRPRHPVVTDSPDPPDIPDDDDALLSECRVDTFRSGGKGGQHQNTTESGVRLVHRPTGVRVESRTERSQHRNRSIALGRLRLKLEKLAHTDPPRKKSKVSRSQKRKRLEAKRRKAEKKKLRQNPKPREVE